MKDPKGFIIRDPRGFLIVGPKNCWVVLVQGTRFMYELCLFLHAINKLIEEYSLHQIDKLKILLNNSNQA